LTERSPEDSPRGGVDEEAVEPRGGATFDPERNDPGHPCPRIDIFRE
jgi:hypothetical protein